MDQQTVKFFEDNERRISPATDPVMHNLNAGLLMLAKDLSEVNARLGNIERRLAHLLRS